MLIVILALGTTDLLFALDSIPAIYGLTKEPYLVLTANIFALMGLRQLYFLIGGLLKRLVYLSIGLAVLLGFIGVKLFLHALHENNLPFINGGQPFDVPDIPILVSLGAIVLILGVTTVASLLKTRSDNKKDAAEGITRDSDGNVIDVTTSATESRHPMPPKNTHPRPERAVDAGSPLPVSPAPLASCDGSSRLVAARLLGLVDGHLVADADGAGAEEAQHGTASVVQRASGARAERVIEETARGGDAHHFELDVTDGDPGARLRRHRPARHGDVAAGQPGVDWAPELLGRGLQRLARLDRHVPVLAAVVAVPDEPRTRLGEDLGTERIGRRRPGAVWIESTVAFTSPT